MTNGFRTAGSEAERRRLVQCKSFSLGASLAVLGLGVSALWGWLFDIELLKRVHPAWTTMKANSAFCFICAGFSLWLLNLRPATGLKLRLAQACALAVTVVGLLTLGEYLSGHDWGIDQLLIREHPANAQAPLLVRMAVGTALSFVILGIALVILDVETNRGRWPSQHLVLAAAFVTLLAFVGNFYGVAVGYENVSRGSVAFHTIAAFFLLCLGILLARPDRGIMANLSSDSIGGVLMRRLLPAALLLPVLLGWLSLLGEQLGLYGPAASSALFATSILVVFGGLVLWTAQTLNRVEMERWRAVESHQQLAAIVESSDDAIVSKNLDGIITSWNQGAERIFGYTAAEVVGQPILMLIPADHVNEEQEILERLRRGERIEHFETVRRRKDASLVDVSLTISPIKDSRGQIVGASKIARDITEQKRSQERLRRSEEHFRVTLASIGDAVIVTDGRADVTFMNPVAEQLTGYTLQEAQGAPLSSLFKIINESSRKPVEVPVNKVLQQGVVVGLANDTVLISKDGTERPILDSAAPIRNANGELSGVVLVFRDVTEHHAAELRARRLAAIVESSDDAIIGKNLNGIIANWNQGAERMFGYTAQEAVGQPISLIVPAERHHEEEQILARLRRGERILHFETIRRRKDGTLLDVSLTMSPIKDSLGRIVGASKIARDITERKRSEQALRQSETSFRTLAEELEIKVQERTAQLQTSLNSVEDLLYTIAHDLRAPNRTMQGFAQLIQLEYGDQLDAAARDYLNRISTAAVHNDELIRDLLEYGRLSHEEVPLAPVDLRQTVESVLNNIEGEIRQRHAHIHLGGEWPVVVANEGMLKQILTNLLTNALIYVPPDREPDITIASESENAKAVLRVKDNGIGIPPEQIDRAFKPFIRLPNPIHTPGTGMGLAIVKKAAERMDAAVGAESTPGRGACFWLELPTA